eukprot:gene4317-6625_t
MEAIIGILHTLAATLVSPLCADTFFLDMNFLDKECLTLTLSKGLGYGVVAGAAIVKVPQIIKILKAKSAQGVSLAAHLQELLVYTVSLTRNLRLGHPISTWGENVFITVQLLVLIWLIVHYNGQRFSTTLIIYSIWTALTYILLNGIRLAKTLNSLCIPIAAFSRLTQIVTIIRNGATGQLSPITSGLNFIGAVARVGTTLKEVDDVVILTNFLVSALLNFTIFALFFIYRQDRATDKSKKTK